MEELRMEELEDSRGQHRARFRVAFEALQVGAHVGGALIAQVAIFFEQLVQDFFEVRRQFGIQAKRRRGGDDSELRRK
jgi:hypothetical protein